jgi:hypothetical protein
MRHKGWLTTKSLLSKPHPNPKIFLHHRNNIVIRHKGWLTATNLATHQHLRCDLYLHNVYHDRRQRNRHSLTVDGNILNVGAKANASKYTITAKRPITSEFSKAQFDRGNEWEANLFQWLDKTGLLLTVSSGPLQGHDIWKIVDLDERLHFFVAGLEFSPNHALREGFRKAGMGWVEFGMAKPDLLEIKRWEDRSFTWRVIDAKASKVVKVNDVPKN